jgi:hypothetical protein
MRGGGGARAWEELGRELGLSTALVSERSMLGWSFASFRRELAEPLTPEPKAMPWLHGAPVEILLEPSDAFVRTTVRALFPAPLGAGIIVSRSASTSFTGLFAQAPLVLVGEPSFDSSFLVQALDGARARAILGRAVRERLPRAAAATAHVVMDDAEVLLAQERCVAPRELGTLIDDALAIVAAATPSIPTPPYR